MAETPAVMTETFVIFLTPSGNRFLPNPFRISSDKYSVVGVGWSDIRTVSWNNPYENRKH